jgi:hypothetical protein
MPNHITNTLEIRVWHNEDKETIKKVREFIRPEGSECFYIDFAAIVPPPENMFTDDLSKEDRERCAEQGIPNWYDWQRKHWGTKWNAYNEDLRDESDSTLVLRFDTAWSPPEPVIAALRAKLEEMFPEEDGYEVYVAGSWVEEGYQSAGVF